jgi:4-amino-4-deoxychorismate lyase
LSIQPLLAGIKHLNRLEQILARCEWPEPGPDEGLMLNTDNQVIAATAGNLCIRLGRRWLTPSVDRCGIAGVARRWIMERFDVAESVIDPSVIDSADALVICNALRGPRQVMALGSRTWEASDEVDEWRRQWDAQFVSRPDAQEICR